jgi:hypothetical protein
MILRKWIPSVSRKLALDFNPLSFGRNPESAIANLLVELASLIDIGARNFLFVDVPPIHRIPSCQSFNIHSLYDFLS